MSNSALLGSLRIFSEVDTSKLGPGLLFTEQSVKKTVGSVVSTGASLLPVFGALASVGGVVTTALSGLGQVDAMKNVAAEVGETTQSVAELAGVSRRAGTAAENLFAGIKRLNKERAALEAGDASNGLAQLGFTLEQIAGLTSTELLGEVSERLNAIEDSGKRATMAQEVFGKGYSALNEVIGAGRAGIEAFAKEANQTGEVLSTTQTTRVNEANDAWNRFKAATAGVTMQLAAALAPAFEGVFEAGEFFLTSVVQPLTPALWVMAEAIGFVGKVAATAFNVLTLGLFGRNIRDIWSAQEKLAEDTPDQLGAVTEAWSDLARELEHANATFGMSELDKKLAEFGAKTGDGSYLGILAEEAEALKHKQTITETIADLERELTALTATRAEQEIAAAAATGKDAEAIRSLAEKIELKKQEIELNKEIAQAQFDLDTFGMGARDKRIAELRAQGRDPGALEALYKELDAREAAVEAEKEAARERKRIADEIARAEQQHADRIAQLKERALTDEERKMRDIAEISTAFFAGEITGDEYGKLLAQLQEQPAAADKDKSFKGIAFGGGAAFGSEAARDSLLRAASIGAGGDVWVGLKKTAESQLAEEKQQNAHLAKIANQRPKVASF